jgi:putative membrane protein
MFATPAIQAQQPKASPDAAFVMEAAMGGMMEVELGRLALERSGTAEVKQFGQRMIDDHGKGNMKLMGIAQQKGITVPTALSGKAKSEHDKLAKVSGPAFDRAYMDLMVRDHKKDIEEFQEEASKGQDAEVKAFASETLPTLQAHLKMAEEGKASVNKRPADTSDRDRN